MNSYNTTGAGSYHFFDLARIESMGFGVNVAKDGVISCHWRAWAVAMNVKEGTITSPVNSVARIAISKATVPLQVVMQCFTPSRLLIRCSNSWT